MLLDFSAMDRRTAYFWMASTIVPRPVAWVTSRALDGTLNLAPFSFFQMIAPQPPTLMFCPQHNGDGSLKDPAESPTCTMILGEVRAAHADPAIVGEDGIIDPVRLDVGSRMGADWYGRTNSTTNFRLPRPAGWAR